MRVYRTLSLSLHPRTVARLEEIGKATGRTGARVAAEIVAAALDGPESAIPPARGVKPRMEDRVSALEAEMAEVKARLTRLDLDP